MNPPIQQLTDEFVAEGALAVVLVGSFARQEQDPYSDLDFHVLLAEQPEQGGRYFYREGWLVSVGYRTLERQEQAFTDAQTALWNIQAMQTAHILHDPQGLYAALQQRALRFSWEQVQDQVPPRISGHLHENIEECHKLMGALQHQQPEKALFALQNLKWMLGEISAFAHAAFVPTENRYWSTIRDAEPDLLWKDLFWETVGMTGAQPLQRGEAALKLYLRTYQLYGHHLQPEHQATVQHTVGLIERFLGAREKAQS